MAGAGRAHRDRGTAGLRTEGPVGTDPSGVRGSSGVRSLLSRTFSTRNRQRTYAGASRTYAAQPNVGPFTGVAEYVTVVWLPNCFIELSPQQATVALLRMEHEWSSPTEMAAMPELKVVTGVDE